MTFMVSNYYGVQVVYMPVSAIAIVVLTMGQGDGGSEIYYESSRYLLNFLNPFLNC